MSDWPQYSSANTGYGPNCLTHVIFFFQKSMDYIFFFHHFSLHNQWEWKKLAFDKINKRFYPKGVSKGADLFWCLGVRQSRSPPPGYQLCRTSSRQKTSKWNQSPSVLSSMAVQTHRELHRIKPILYHVLLPINAVLFTFWTQLTYHFNRRTAEPLGPSPAPGCDEPTSRCRTSPSMWALGGD